MKKVVDFLSRRLMDVTLQVGGVVNNGSTDLYKLIKVLPKVLRD